MQQFVHLVRLRESQQTSSIQAPSQIVNDTLKQSKGQVIAQLATLGFYDLVIIAQYPDQRSAFQASTSLKTQHGWITETMAAEDLSAFDQIYNSASRETTRR